MVLKRVSTGRKTTLSSAILRKDFPLKLAQKRCSKAKLKETQYTLCSTNQTLSFSMGEFCFYLVRGRRSLLDKTSAYTAYYKTLAKLFFFLYTFFKTISAKTLKKPTAIPRVALYKHSKPFLCELLFLTSKLNRRNSKTH